MQSSRMIRVKDLRNDYARVEEMLKEHDVVQITKNGELSAVLIHPEDFEKYQNFMHIQYVLGKLDEAETWEADPDTKYVDALSFFAELKDKYKDV